MGKFVGQLRRWLPLLLIAAGLVGLLSGNSPAIAQRVLATCRDAGPPAFVLVGTLMMCLFVPKTFVSIAAGSIFGLSVGCATLTVTAVVSAWVNYHLGRWSMAGKRELATQVGAASANFQGTRWRVLITQVRGIAKDAGLGTHLLVRLSPVPTTIISYTMGASRARQTPYLIAAMLATGPQWLWVHCGATAATMDHSDSARWAGLGCSILAALLLSVLVPRQIWKRRDNVIRQPEQLF